MSTDEQYDSGAGIAVQLEAIRRAGEQRGWTVEFVMEEGRSARDLRRPKLIESLKRLDAGEADLLCVSKLDRLSRSVNDFTGLVRRAERNGWAVACLDLDVDTSTPAGDFMVNVMSAAAQYERRLISQRTKDALAMKRAQGVRLGRPPVVPDAVLTRVVHARRSGESLRSIAASLTEDGVPTARGGAVWGTSSVDALLRSSRGMAVRL